MDTHTVQLALILVTIVALVSLNKDKVAEKLVDAVSLFPQQPRVKKPRVKKPIVKKPNQEETK